MQIFKALIIIIILATNAYANCQNHKDFIYGLKNQVDNVVSFKDKESQVKMLQEIIKSNVDLHKISRFIIGKHWILTQKATKEDFLREYEAYFVRLCIRILYNNIKSNEMTIMGTKKIDNMTYIVNTRFSHDNNEDFTNIDFQVTKKSNSFLISDITISGISISINQRAKLNKKIDIYGIEKVTEELKHDNNP